MSLKEAYSKFAEKHTDSKIGLSKFCEFRPMHVKLFEHIPHHVCVCVYHENVEGGSYPGEITFCDHDDVQVNVMHKCGKYGSGPIPMAKYFTDLKTLLEGSFHPKWWEAVDNLYLWTIFDY